MNQCFVRAVTQGFSEEAFIFSGESAKASFGELLGKDHSRIFKRGLSNGNLGGIDHSAETGEMDLGNAQIHAPKMHCCTLSLVLAKVSELDVINPCKNVMLV